MATKTVKTRIQNKHDVEANWLQAENFIPLAGEVIVYDKDDTHAQPRIKIGDGATKVSQLPFCTGIALEEEGSDSIPFVDMAHLANGQEVKY